MLDIYCCYLDRRALHVQKTYGEKANYNVKSDAFMPASTNWSVGRENMWPFFNKTGPNGNGTTHPDDDADACGNSYATV